MARKIVTPSTTPSNPTPANGVTVVANATGVNWAYTAQAPKAQGKPRGISQGSVGAALLTALANGPITLAAAQAAVNACIAQHNRKGTHPVQPLCRFIAVHGGAGLGFACTNGMLSMATYVAPPSQ